jgi:hypothetical protein
VNTYNHILTKKEKLIISDMLMGTSNTGVFEPSQKQYKVKELCAKIIRKHTRKPFSLGNKWKEEFKDYSINLIWNKDTNETVVMHFLGVPNYPYSSKIFEEFKVLNSDINAINKDGATALILLAKNPSRYTICSTLMYQYPKLDLNIKDKDEKTFHMYFFENCTEEEMSYKYNHEDFRSLALGGKISTFKEVLLNWVEADIVKKKEHMLYVSEKCSMIIRVVDNTSNSFLQEHIKNIEIIADKLHLEATVGINSNNQKKPKI